MNLLIQIQKAQLIPGRINPIRPTARHIIELLKDKERIFKAPRKKLITYKGSSMRISAEISTETLEVRTPVG